MKYFKTAQRIWAKSHLNELNCNLIFHTNFKKRAGISMVIAGNNVFSVYLNGKLIHYGPARAAHDLYRVDQLELKELNENNNLVIFVNGSYANTFYTLNNDPFLICEVRCGDEIICSTGTNFNVYNNVFRIRKVLRYSYQRGFSESYHLDERYIEIFKGNFSNISKEEIIVLPDNNAYFARNVNYISFDILKGNHFESGKVYRDESLPLYDDRYMHLDFLKIFSLDELEDNPNLKVCKYKYELKEKTKGLKSQEFKTFKFTNSYTGFFKISLKIKKTSQIFIIFDEMTLSKDNLKPIDINCFRNTTNNVISLKLEKGKYNFINFEPYSAKYIRVICDEGEVEYCNISLLKYETKRNHEFNFECSNVKVRSIMKAVYSTYKQNSVDMFTDCPSRERAGWLCDSFFEGKASQILDTSNNVEKNFLENFAYFKAPNLPKNMVPMCYPAELTENDFIPQWSLWYILELYDYKNRTADLETVEISLKNVRNLVTYFKEYENKDGYISNIPGWNFVEWSDCNLPEHLEGINFPTNMLYSEALVKAGLLLNDLSLISKGQSLKEKIKNDAFDGTFFVDNGYLKEDGSIQKSKYYSETCQYYAFYFGIATREKFSDLFDIMLNNFGPNGTRESKYSYLAQSNVLPGYILRLSILNKEGYLSESFKEIVEYFYDMSVLTGTIWEHNGTHASLNHGFTSVIANFLMNDYFGLKEINAIKKEIRMSIKALKKQARTTIYICNLPVKFINDGKEVVVENNSKYKIVYDID